METFLEDLVKEIYYKAQGDIGIMKIHKHNELNNEPIVFIMNGFLKHTTQTLLQKSQSPEEKGIFV